MKYQGFLGTHTTSLAGCLIISYTLQYFKGVVVIISLFHSISYCSFGVDMGVTKFE